MAGVACVKCAMRRDYYYAVIIHLLHNQSLGRCRPEACGGKGSLDRKGVAHSTIRMEPLV